MKTFFSGLFEYNLSVNKIITCSILENIDHVLKRTIDVAGHIQLVHQSWNNRMLGKDGLTDFWQPLNTDQLLDLCQTNTISSLKIIDLYELNATFTYKNSKGVAFNNTYADVLFHVINHSSYHRGQINSGLRSVGIEPVITDYIFYKR